MMEDKIKQHFNSIAENYKEEIADHIRDHLINKFYSLVSCYFPNNCKAIDIGCGDGTNVAFLRSKGVNTMGVDISCNLIKRGKERYPELRNVILEGDALNLEFKNNTFDIGIMIGILHHIHSRHKQVKAINEALRVVKDNGVVIIRECNLRNPFFRIFWNYVFPLTNKIDRFGGEYWIPASYFRDTLREAMDNIFYFTFIPSFTPHFLHPFASKVEKCLEKSPFKKQAAHYVVILRKRGRF